MIYPGLVSITFRQLKTHEIIELVKRSGLAAIEWGGDIHVPHGDIQTAERVAKETKQAGLRVAAYGSYYKLGVSEPDLKFEDVLNSAVALNAPTVRVWAGDKASKSVSEHEREKITEDAKRCAKMALKAGVTLTLEYHGNTLTDSTVSAQQLMAEIGHSSVCFGWQPPNLRPIDECEDGLRRVMPWLNTIHVFHWADNGQGKIDRRPLSEGAECWIQYLKLASCTARDHAALIEFVRGDSTEQFLEDAEVLKDLIRKCCNI